MMIIAAQMSPIPCQFFIDSRDFFSFSRCSHIWFSLLFLWATFSQPVLARSRTLYSFACGVKHLDGLCQVSLEEIIRFFEGDGGNGIERECTHDCCICRYDAEVRFCTDGCPRCVRQYLDCYKHGLFRPRQNFSHKYPMNREAFSSRRRQSKAQNIATFNRIPLRCHVHSPYGFCAAL